VSKPVGNNKSDLVLAELKKRKAQQSVVDVEEKKMKVVIFSLQGGLFAFSGENVKEILPLANIYPVPGTPDYIPGVVNIRGEIESVVTMNGFLGLPESEKSSASRIAVAQKEGVRSGILVDSVTDVTDIPVSIIKPPLNTLEKGRKEFVAGEFFYQNKNIILLDIGKIFAKITS
jgi:purine-binding chemotaxis protein CheW